MPSRRFRRRIAALRRVLCSSWATYAVAGLIIVAAVGNNGLIISKLTDWQLLPRPERVTELAFTRPRELAAKDMAGNRLVTFDVHNVEHRTTRYHYTIITSVPEHRLQVTHGSLTLAHDARRTVTRSLAIPYVSQRIKVQVTLHYYALSPGKDTSTMQSQSIHYWI